MVRGKSGLWVNENASPPSPEHEVRGTRYGQADDVGYGRPDVGGQSRISQQVRVGRCGGLWQQHILCVLFWSAYESKRECTPCLNPLQHGLRALPCGGPREPLSTRGPSPEELPMAESPQQFTAGSPTTNHAPITAAFSLVCLRGLYLVHHAVVAARRSADISPRVGVVHSADLRVFLQTGTVFFGRVSPAFLISWPSGSHVLVTIPVLQPRPIARYSPMFCPGAPSLEFSQQAGRLRLEPE